MTEISNIRCESIVSGINDRKDFDPIALRELADSITEHGLAQPITVRPIVQCPLCGTVYSEAPLPCSCSRCGHDDLTDRFQIVAGERRFRAISQMLQWDSAPCIIRDLDDEAASSIMLVENTSRADLSPIEEARAYQSRIDRFGWDPSRISKVAGVSEALVKRRLLLLQLTADIQQLVSTGQLPIGHAEAMTSLDSNRQRIAARIFSESSGMTLRVFRGVVSQLLEEQSQQGLFDLENFWVEQVQTDAELPTRGKRAIVDVPTRQDLPKIFTDGKDSTSSVIRRYISALECGGLSTEAATIGTLYTALVRLNFMSVS